MKTKEVARAELQNIADQVTKLGYQVTFVSTVETEGSMAGHGKYEIRISTYTKKEN